MSPSAQDCAELLAFLPPLSAPGFKPVIRWAGGEKRADGTINMPWPEYADVVEDFFQAAGREVWTDRKYRSAGAGKMLENHDFVRTASLQQIKTMLTFCVRGERFCDGHWEEMIESGNICRLLERLSELYEAIRKQEGA